MEPKKRETSKTVVIEGRTFLIKKFDAMTGSYIAFKITTKALPMGFAMLLKEDEAKGIPFDASKVEMSKKEFMELQLDCLNVCSEIVGENTIPVLNENNTFRAIGLNEDTRTVLALTVHSLMFNMKDFFGESVFKLIVGDLAK